MRRFWQAQLLGQLAVYAVPHVIEVGVGGVNGDVVFQRLHDGLLYFVSPSQAFERAENDGMVAHHHVAAAPQSFVHHGWGAVERNQNAGYFGLRVAALQAGIVILFLVGEGRCLFKGAGKVSNGGHGASAKTLNEE